MLCSDSRRSEINERPSCFVVMRTMPRMSSMLVSISKLQNDDITFMEHLQAAHATM